MSEWYYSRTNDEREGPVSEERILELIADGTLRPRALVWQEGMAEWTEVRREFKRTPTRAPSTALPAAGKDSGAGAIPSGLPGWMLLIAILSFLIGISTLCFFGLGIFPILAGVYLLKARHLLDEISSIDPAWEEVLNKLRGYFMMLGLFTVLHLGLIAFLIFYNFGIGFLGNFR